MALTNFGKVIVSSIGLGLVGVFISAAAPAFAENGTDTFADSQIYAEQAIVATEEPTAPKFNLLLLPDFPKSDTKTG